MDWAAGRKARHDQPPTASPICPPSPAPALLHPHAQEMKRALFLYAKLNPGLCYIQGMNELIAPLYYLFKIDPDREVGRGGEERQAAA